MLTFVWNSNVLGVHIKKIIHCSFKSIIQPPNSNAIATMALENFVEMRDTVGNPKFLLMKAVENILENEFEEIFRSRYALVCYGGGGNITYSSVS